MMKRDGFCCRTGKLCRWMRMSQSVHFLIFPMARTSNCTIRNREAGMLRGPRPYSFGIHGSPAEKHTHRLNWDPASFDLMELFSGLARTLVLELRVQPRSTTRTRIDGKLGRIFLMETISPTVRPRWSRTARC